MGFKKCRYALYLSDMSIREIAGKIKEAASGGGEWTLPVVMVAVGVGSFGLGRLSMTEVVRAPVMAEAAQSASVNLAPGGLLVAARNGTAYYFPWCAGAERIKSENRITFESEQAARDAGFRPAKNCQGLGESD